MTNKFALLSLTRYFQIFRHVAFPVVFVLLILVREVGEVMRPVVRGLRAHVVVALDQAVAVVGHRQVVDEIGIAVLLLHIISVLKTH